MLSLWNRFLALSLVTQKVNFPSDISGKKQVKVVFKKTLLFQIAFNIKRDGGKREEKTQTAALEVLKACSENLCDDSLKKAAFMCYWAHLHNVF